MALGLPLRPVSFLNVVVFVNGVELTGWADGDDVITLKRLADSASHKIGAAGDMMVSLSADRSGEISFKLQKISLSNAYLNSLLNAQESPGGVAFVPMNVLAQDTFRQDMGVGSNGYIVKVPDLQFGEKAGNQEWMLRVENLANTFGAAIVTA